MRERESFYLFFYTKSILLNTSSSQNVSKNRFVNVSDANFEPHTLTFIDLFFVIF